MTTLFHKLQKILRSILFDPAYFWTLAILIIAGDVVLTQLIIRFVPYTEIDWETYMVQVSLYLKGERDYAQITGPTGPLVYPAGHVHIHRYLYKLTNAGTNINLIQQIYAALYTISLIFTCAIYRRVQNIPNWVLLLLPCSKRLHSVFVLRLFNDCWSIVAMQAAILAYQLGLDDTGTLLFSAALSVKMSVLLYLPGLLVILFKRHGLASTLRHLLSLLSCQVLLAWPFITGNAWSYMKYSFDLSRVFLFKWTVNWRFLDEDVFLSPGWARGLMVGHLCILTAFGMQRWCRGDGNVWTVLERGLRRPTRPAGIAPVSADYVTTVLFTSNLIGILFARSLHYQFYSWYAQQLPFLAWRTRYPLLIKLFILVSIEYAWNVFPSTTRSSTILCAANGLLLAGIWFGYPEGQTSI